MSKTRREGVGAIGLKAQFRKYWQICILVLPALAILAYFKYYPMYGVQIAFRDYRMADGFSGSRWIGLKMFGELFLSKGFLQALRNTLVLNLYQLVFAFPAAVVFGLLMNELRNLRFKRFVQTATYLPHFLSWVIVYALFNNLLALNTGMVNRIVSFFGGEQVIFLTSTRHFRAILIISDIWKNIGWNTIVILAGITAIDPTQYEAAVMDGASRLGLIRHVTLPGIRSTIMVLFILRVGGIMQNDVTQVLLFYNPAVYEVGDVIGTYIYRQGLGQLDFSLTSAAGLFQSGIGMVLIFTTNKIAHMMGERGVW